MLDVARSSECSVSKEWNDLLLTFYKSIDSSPSWQSFVEMLTSVFVSASAIMVIRPSSEQDLGFLVCSDRAADATIRKYQESWYDLDPLRVLPADKVIIGSEIMADEEWQQCVFYKDFFIYTTAIGVDRILAVNIVTSSGTFSRLRIHRGPDQPPFSAEDKAKLTLLVPHLKQGLHLAALIGRKEIERQLFEETLDRLHIGTIILDETQHILRTNAAARELMAAKDGLRNVNGMIEGCYASDSRNIRDLLARTANDPDMMLTQSLSRPDTDRKLGIVVRSIPLIASSEGKVRPAWALFLRDPDARSGSMIDAIQQMFDFTRAEATLAAELANGLTLDEAADAMGIKRNTARAHLRSVFVKAGVTRQTELVRILLNGVIGLS